MDAFRQTMRFSPTPSELWLAANGEGPRYLCLQCGGLGLTALCARDGRRAWPMGPSAVSPPTVGKTLGDQWVCAKAEPVAPLTWSLELAALKSPRDRRQAVEQATALQRPAERGIAKARLQGLLAAAPCLAELAPAYCRWAALHEQLRRACLPGVAPAIEPLADSGGWLTACDLGLGRPLSELMRPHGEVRGVGQRQTARVLAEVAEILLRLEALGLAHGQVSLSTVTVQPGPAGHQSYQLIPPPLPPVPTERILEYCTPWQLVCLAPEQLQGGLPTPESEVFALGAMAFVLATGRPPFGDWDQPRTMASGARSGRSPMVRLWLPESTQEFVEPLTRALALDPARRPTLAEFAAQMALAERSSRRAFAQTNSPANKPEQPGLSHDTHMDLAHAIVQRTPAPTVPRRTESADSSL